MMARAGLGVLIVEHNLPIVFDVADEVTVLDEGQVIATGTPAEVSRDPEVVRVYIGRQRLDRPGGDGSTQGDPGPGVHVSEDKGLRVTGLTARAMAG